MTLPRDPRRQCSRSVEIGTIQARLGAGSRRLLGFGRNETERNNEVGRLIPERPDLETVFPLFGLGRRTEAAQVAESMAAVAAANLDEVAARLAAILPSPAGPAR